MDIFKHDSQCKKCGSVLAESRYHNLGCKCSFDILRKEHICRICQRCGYAWPEYCIDVNDKPNKLGDKN